MSDELPKQPSDLKGIVEAESAIQACGLIMPIADFDGCSSSHWNEVRLILTAAIESIDKPRFTAKMVSDSESSGTIHSNIVQNVYSNPIVVCDVSGRNPNVLFELGMRIAFDRPVVIVKDDETAFSFDISPLLHIQYPRSLRHGSIEQFKTELAAKVKATHADWQQETGKPSYIQSFGPITKVRFEERTESPDKAMMEMLKAISRRLDIMSSPLVGTSSDNSTIGASQTGVYFGSGLKGAIFGNGLAATTVKIPGAGRNASDPLSHISSQHKQRLIDLFDERARGGRPTTFSWFMKNLPSGLGNLPLDVLAGIFNAMSTDPEQIIEVVAR